MATLAFTTAARSAFRGLSDVCGTATLEFGVFAFDRVTPSTTAWVALPGAFALFVTAAIWDKDGASS